MKLRTKEFVLLSLPAVLLPLLALLVQKPQGNDELTLVRSQVRTASKSPSDMEVSVIVKYASSSRLPEYITRPSYGCSGWTLVDSKGRPVSFSPSGGGEGPSGNYLYGFTLYFSKSSLPKHAGQLILKTAVTVNNKTLPVSLVVRKS